MRARAGTAHGACYDARADQKHAVPAASCGQQALAPARPERIEPRAAMFARRADPHHAHAAQAHGRGGYVRPAGRRARSCSENESSRPAAGRRRRRWPRRARPRPKSSEKQRFQVAAAQGARGQCSPKPQRPAWWRTVRHEKGAGCRLSDEMKPGACMRCFRARSDRSAPPRPAGAVPACPPTAFFFSSSSGARRGGPR